MSKIRLRNNYTHELNRLADCIRMLSIDAVQKAASGHPGMPMATADIATVLFTQFLEFDPKNPKWPNRDRFVLSNGHGSMLLYSTLHLLGYDISLDDIKKFRQLGSITPGHPESFITPGIEATTGPLGQGLGNAVGMALAERMLNAEFGDDLINHHTYALVGDGCLMEGVSQEAISFAAHYNLNKLIVLFDSNSISIDGDISLASSEDQVARFAAAGWNTHKIDGHNIDQIIKAVTAAKQSDKPTFIECETTIAFGSPKLAGSEKSHGAPLGSDEIADVRKELDWKWGSFIVPEEFGKKWKEFGAKSHKACADWYVKFNKLSADKKLYFEERMSNSFAVTKDLQKKLDGLKMDILNNKPNEATRKTSGTVLNTLVEHLPILVGGSADLSESTNVITKHSKPITKKNYKGNYIHYGIREHAMGAIMNGLSLHGGFIPYGSTFLVFSDYMRPAIRLSALTERKVVYVFTHDSIGLGEDGPTHQPIEHLASLRLIPNLRVFRPGDATEVLECLEYIMMHSGHKHPAALILTRQNLPAVRTEFTKENSCSKGAYEIYRPKSNPCAILMSSGSELHMALKVKDLLNKKGYVVGVVSIPCAELFDEQPAEYKSHILGGKEIPKIVIEAAATGSLDKYIASGASIGLNEFGASAPADKLFTHFKFTAEDIAKRIEHGLKNGFDTGNSNSFASLDEDEDYQLENDSFSFHEL